MRIKNSILIVLLFSFSAIAWGQNSKDLVVMTIDGRPITKQEFLHSYLKNNDHPRFDTATLNQYMVLYKEFRLKVAEAEAEQYDTLPDIKRELKKYQNELAKPYLVDSAKREQILKEAYQRMKYKISASHILVKVGRNASPKDTLKAYNKIMKIRNLIVKEGKDFGKVAQEYSEDPSAKKNKGYLGYFSAFQMVYPFESAAYHTKVGEVSMPIRSNFGYHIIKVDDKKPSKGTITTAHIMVALPKDAPKDQVEKAKKKIDEIYQKLKEGASFSKMAKLYSDDRNTKFNGGELPPFGVGTRRRMVPSFTKAAFALKKDGDFSKPFRTSYGFHIVKRLSLKPMGTFEELKPKIESRVKRDSRGKISKNTFIADLKKKNHFKEKSKKGLQWLNSVVDSTIYSKNWVAPKAKKNRTLFEYRGKEYKLEEFINYLKDQYFRKTSSLHSLIAKAYKKWQNKIIINNEKNHLKEEYPAYKSLLQEFHDGILLYAIMKDKVWNKAIKDTVGLQHFYEAHISDYQWPDRVKAMIFYGTKKENVEKAQQLSAVDSLTVQDILNKVNKNSELSLSGKEGKFIPSKVKALKDLKLTVGSHKIRKLGEKYYFVKIEKKIPAGPKKLDEARGAVVQDYQNQLESDWLKKLTKKHTIKVNKKVLYNLGD